MAFHVTIGLVLATICLAVPQAEVATAAPMPDRPLRVATKVIAPFVLPKTDPLTGFSIDLWTELARRMRVEFTWSVVPTLPDLLRAVRRGDADVAIAAITITPEREKLLDFSYPYFDSGLQIMVRAQNENALLSTFRSIPWLAIGELFGAAIIVFFLLANVLWLIERRHNRNFQKPYLRAIGEGLWGTTLIIATGEHGDRDVPRVWKRFAVATMWLLGVVMIAQLTATVTTSQTVQRLRSIIQGPDDLPGKTIASVQGTAAADYLTARGLSFTPVRSAPETLRLLQQGAVQAMVFDAPALEYWAAKEGRGVLEVVGPIFRPEKYAIAVANGSALRKRIDITLLEIYKDGTYEKIHSAWFSGR